MSAAPRTSTKASIPDRLQDLLVREAAFTLSRKRIIDALQVAQDSKTSTKAGRPLLAFIFRDAKKELERREMVENVSVMEEGVRNIDAALPKLQAYIERSIENFLREFDQEYANGLAGSRFLDDWKRLLLRFDETVTEFVSRLNGLKSLFESLPQSEPCSSDREARKRIDAVVACARAFQDEVVFVNKIADAQRIRAGSEAITLYRQPDRNWKGTANSLLFTMPGPAIATVILLLNESTDTAGKVRSAIQGECQLASYVTQLGVTSYHQRVWTSLREAALLRVEPDSIESILTDTEDKLKKGLFEPWVSPRIDRPEDNSQAIPIQRFSASSSAPNQAAPSKATPGSTSPVSLPSRPPGAPRPPGEHSLRLPSRNHGAATPPATIPAMSVQPEATPPPPSAPSVPETGSLANPFETKEAADTVADLAAERIRLEEILQEERKGLEQREQFLSKSEERLLQKTQEQIEREMELEQREEQLRDLEKRLREKLGPGALPFPAAALATASSAVQPFDEFKE